MNLLPRSAPRKPFSRLDAEQFKRYRSRLEGLKAICSAGEMNIIFDAGFDDPEASLEELEAGGSLITALDLLDGIDRVRRETEIEIDSRLAKSPRMKEKAGDLAGGELICFWPGRSLSTGEAELASRGLFDLMDRPPIVFWLEAIARPRPTTQAGFEVAILAWIPSSAVDRARAGREACRSGALAWLREVSEDLASQLQPTLAERPPGL